MSLVEYMEPFDSNTVPEKLDSDSAGTETLHYLGRGSGQILSAGVFGRSRSMLNVMTKVRRVAPTAATVLITGESGTGKEVIARTIHDNSKRADKPFIAVNCGAISPNLIESELFGHEKGSFTGAVRTHHGVFEQADGGTLFLDEVTDMPVELQVKLLRVLETQRFVRVGSDHEQSADVRIIAATNKCPEDEVESAKLRSDLLYRLQVFPIELPALRERREDIGDLVRYFLQELNCAEGCKKSFSPEAIDSLESYRWPGNIRELKNVVQRVFIMADTLITRSDLPPEITRPELGAGAVRQRGSTLTVDIGASMAKVERNLIMATLGQCEGRKEKAANILGISMKTLYNRLRKYEQEDSNPEA